MFTGGCLSQPIWDPSQWAISLIGNWDQDFPNPWEFHAFFRQRLLEHWLNHLQTWMILQPFLPGLASLKPKVKGDWINLRES